MLSLEDEIAILRDGGELPLVTADRLIAVERRSPMSVHFELRAIFWLAVTLIATGVGIYLKNNIDRIGHLTLILLIGAASAACYAIAWRRKRSGLSSAADDYLVFLGALLLSADVAYIETQYRILGDNWRHDLLILATVHGVTAYLYDSRILLTLSIVSLAGWLGIDNRGEFFSQDSWETGARLLTVAGLILLWRFLNHQRERWRHFDEIFDNAIVHAAMIGALVWVFDKSTEATGLVLLAMLVTASVVWGIRNRRESFIIYGFIYGLIGAYGAILPRLDEAAALGVLLLTTPLAIVALFMIHRRWRSDW